MSYFTFIKSMYNTYVHCILLYLLQNNSIWILRYWTACTGMTTSSRAPVMLCKPVSQVFVMSSMTTHFTPWEQSMYRSVTKERNERSKVKQSLYKTYHTEQMFRVVSHFWQLLFRDWRGLLHLAHPTENRVDC